MTFSGDRKQCELNLAELSNDQDCTDGTTQTFNYLEECFDYRSVMMFRGMRYGKLRNRLRSNIFPSFCRHSSNGYPTMTAKIPGINLGYHVLSPLDRYNLNSAFSCPNTTPRPECPWQPLPSRQALAELLSPGQGGYSRKIIHQLFSIYKDFQRSVDQYKCLALDSNMLGIGPNHWKIGVYGPGEWTWGDIQLSEEM